MEANNSVSQPAATEINLHDIFWYILKNWIILLVCMAVFGAFLGLYKRSSQAKAVQASEDAVKAYNALSDEEKAKVKAADIPKAVAKSTISSAMKKYMVLGAVVGLFLGAAVLAVYYVIQGYLANAPAIRSRYQLPTFGILPSSKLKGLSRKIMNKLTYAAGLERDGAARLTAANLAMRLRADDTVLLIGTVPEKTLEHIEKLLAHNLNAKIRAVGNVNSEAEAVLALTEKAKVICVEKILKSKQTYVDFAVNTVAASPSELIGFILVE